MASTTTPPTATPFESLPAAEQKALRRAFETLSFVPIAGDESSTRVINEAALPHMCRAMNLSLTDDELFHVCSTMSLERMNSNEEGAPAVPPPAPVVLLPRSTFDLPCVQRIYDQYATRQPELAKEYLQFFNLLDIHETGLVSQADLRHCLCATGERLSDDEFNHLLYANDLLHRPQINVYEFMRILLRISPLMKAL